MAKRKTPPRDSKGRFKKGRGGTKKSRARRNSGRRKSSKAKKNPPKTKTRTVTKYVTRNMPARGSDGKFVRSNPGFGSLPSDWLTSYGGAAAASAGIQIATNTFLAPNFPKIAPLLAPAAELLLGAYTLAGKARNFGAGMFTLGLRDALQAVVGYVQSKMAPAPLPAPDATSQLWMRSPGPFPQPAMSSPLVTGTAVQAVPGLVAERVITASRQSGYRPYATHRQSL